MTKMTVYRVGRRSGNARGRGSDRRDPMNLRLGVLTPATGAVGFVALWWAVYHLKLVDPVLLPSPPLAQLSVK